MPDWGWWLVIGGGVLLLLAFLPGGEDDTPEPTQLQTPRGRSGCLFGWILILLRLKRKKSDLNDFPYFLTDEFLSPAERTFFRVLGETVGTEYYIFPKVRIADVISPEPSHEHFLSYLNKITSKHLDYILCDPDHLLPVLAVELDDSTHDLPDRQERDEFVDQTLEHAGLPLLRVPVQAHYNVSLLRRTIRQMISESQR